MLSFPTLPCIPVNTAFTPEDPALFASCYEACRIGDLKQVQSYLQKQPSLIFQYDYSGQTLLYACAISNELSVMQWLYQQNPLLLKMCRDDGISLMHMAAEQGCLEVVQWLHEKDSSYIDQADSNQCIPLQLAAFNERISVIKFFESKLKKNIGLIQQIAQKNCPKTLAFVLEQQIDPNIENAAKQTLLHLAAEAGQQANVLCLLQYKARIDPRDRSQRTPLFLAAVQGHREIVKLLIKHKADPAVISEEKETILHTTAFYGHTQLLKELLRYPACKNLLEARDQDGKTPLHKAVWGDPKHRIVNLLLENGAKPNVQNDFGYTPLHWAAKHGHIKSAQILLKREDLIITANINNHLPFDLALRFDQDDLIHYFLKTPIRLVTIHEPAESLGQPRFVKDKVPQKSSSGAFLMGRPRVDAVSRGGVDRHHREAFNQKDGLPEYLPRPQVGLPTSTDIEGFYYKCLLQAKQEKLVGEQAFYLLKLSTIYVEKQDFLSGAKILNCALALVDKKNEIFVNYLVKKLAEIEKLFLQNMGIQISATAHAISQKRKRLIEIRKAAEQSSHQGKSIQDTLKDLTRRFQQLLKELILETQNHLGPPPTKWAAIGMGSMSRAEMCPYSDLEFAFLLEKESPKALEYFRTLSRILELKIINLGETKYPVFGERFDSPTPDGFCMDNGGNTPLGVPGIYELIGTPKKLAEFQSVVWMDRNIILPNAMSNICLIAGNKTLVESYNKYKKKTQQLFVKQGAQRKNNEELAMRLLGGHLIEFSPDLSIDKEKETAFGVKKELYRPFQEILGCLTLFYGLKERSTFTRIDELTQLNVLSIEGATNLKKALNLVLSLRLQVHLFYKDEKEFLCHPEEGKPQDSSLYYFNKQDLESLHEIYRVLLPFHKSASEFYKTKSKEAWNKSVFYDDSAAVKAQTFAKTLQYEYAHEAYQQVVSLNPNDVSAQYKLGDFEQRIGKYQGALLRNVKALALAQQNYGENHEEVAICYNNIAVVYGQLGDYDKALNFHYKSLEIRIKLIGEDGLMASLTYSNLGLIYKKLGNYAKACEFYQKALNIRVQSFGTNHPEVALIYNQLGCLYDELAEYTKALEYHRITLTIRLLFLNENHPDVATSYNNTAMTYKHLALYDKALECFQKALRVNLHVLGENHPDLAKIYSNIGLVYDATGVYEKALDFYQKALKIRLQTLTPNHPDIAQNYNNIGITYLNLGKLSEALDSCLKGLTIRCEVLPESHPDLAESYMGIGSIYHKSANPDQALDFYQKALAIRLVAFGERHPDVASCYNHMGGAYNGMGDYKMGLEFYQKGLDLHIQIFGEDHPQVAACYNNIGTLHFDMHNMGQALQFFQKALPIQRKLLGDNHNQIATCYQNIASAHEALQEYNEALQFIEMALSININTFGNNHIAVAQSYQMMASIYRALKEYEKALDCLRSNLNIRFDLLGNEHSSLAQGMEQMASIYFEMGKYFKALELYQNILPMRFQELRDDVPFFIQAYSAIATFFHQRESYTQALNFYQMALKIKVQALGEDHPSVGLSYNQMGMCYEEMGQLNKSLEFHQKYLRIVILEKGENHSEVASACNNVAVAYKSIEDYPKAIEFYHKALMIRIQTFGEDHMSVAGSYNNIGGIYEIQKEYFNALECYRKALGILIHVVGEDHKYVGGSYNMIAKVYYSLGEHQKALETYQKALKVWLQHHAEDAAQMCNIEPIIAQMILSVTKKPQTSLKVMQEVYLLSKKLLGEEHLITKQLLQIVANLTS